VLFHNGTVGDVETAETLVATGLARAIKHKKALVMEPLIMDMFKDTSLSSIQDILTAVPGNKYHEVAKDGVKCSHLLAANKGESLVHYIDSLKPVVEWDSSPFEELLLESTYAINLNDREQISVADAFEEKSDLFNGNQTIKKIIFARSNCGP
jgi:hypothetical protein